MSSLASQGMSAFIRRGIPEGVLSQRPTPERPVVVSKPGAVLSAGEILDKGTRSIEAISVIAIVAAVMAGGYLAYKLWKERQDDEERERAMIGALIEREELLEHLAARQHVVTPVTE